MLNYVWIGMLAAGFLFGMLNGRLEEVTQAVFTSAGRSVELCIGLLGILCLWSGMMKIAEYSGLIRVIARIARPLLRLLYPQVAGSEAALGAIVMNLSANFLGLGNAATPLGIKAMSELQRLNPYKQSASDAMCMFLVMNTAAIQLIPATVIAIRADAGSSAPAEITACIWIASACATVAGILLVKVFSGSREAVKPGRKPLGKRRGVMPQGHGGYIPGSPRKRVLK
jgi:spore maturation protein A